MRLEAGQQIGSRYTLVRRIGSGGMADVWSADDQMLGRQVALKFLHDRFGADEQFVERFRREAQAAAGLQHPNIVSVYDRGEHEGRYFIAMEYVQGAALKDLIERGLSPAESVEIVRQVLTGVRFAHARGIVHRDLKPHNVLVDHEGRARVTDFGIARAGASEITQTGSVLGTAQYLSPEQAQGLETSGSSDIYSVGVILYEALTGQVPFEAETAVAIALKQVSEPPVPPRQINPAIPPALDAVVLKALAKDPKDRYADATEFLRALDAAEANPDAGGTAVYAPIDPLPEEEEKDNRWKWIALAILAALIIAGVVFALTRSEQVLVPSVIGKDRQVATDELEAAGFEVVASDFESCDEPNTVSETDPPAGERVDKGSEVEISVSLGQEVVIPSKGVIDVPAAQATKKLQNENLQVRSEEVSSNGKPGNVVDTEPAPGEKVECESAVTILISKGVKLLTVPDVVGLQQTDADTQLRDAGLIPNFEEEDSDLPEGQVIAQNPAGGSEVKKNTEVTVRYSNGEGTVTVPNVEGQPEDTAVNQLKSRGATNIVIQEQETDDESLDGRVISQAPSAGSQIRASDQVTLYVGLFVEPEVPEEPEEPEDPDAPRLPGLRP
jgi:eukaryotic-like serine/threonine-protein kinase